MDAICAEQQRFHHGHHHHHHVKKPTVEIPPRKLLLSTKKQEISTPTSPDSPEMASIHNKHGWGKSSKMVDLHLDEDASQNAERQEKEYCYDSDSDDPYATDHFRMYEFKIRRCTRSRSHDWTDCPFAHPGEKARRRDPRRYHYSGEVCPEFRRGGGCSRGDDCEFAHGVFECWLHPCRYRTEACKDGKNCKRKVCFFAHSPRQLRVLPPEGSGGGSSLSPASVLGMNKNSRSCCLFCHSVSGSPTSTLLGLSHLSRSPSLSPPLSPANKAAAMSRLRNHAALSYKDVLSELMSSLESMSFSEGLTSSSPVSTPVAASTGISSRANSNIPWIDVGFNHGDQKDPHNQNHLQFALSPCTPNYLNGSSSFDLFKDDVRPTNGGGGGGCSGGGHGGAVASEKGIFDDGIVDPDLGWVNDLLM